MQRMTCSSRLARAACHARLCRCMPRSRMAMVRAKMLMYWFHSYATAQTKTALRLCPEPTDCAKEFALVWPIIVRAIRPFCANIHREALDLVPPTFARGRTQSSSAHRQSVAH